jgi:hypothetical protein
LDDWGGLGSLNGLSSLNGLGGLNGLSDLNRLDGSNDGAPTPPSGDGNYKLRQDQASGREISPVRFGRRQIRKREASDEKRSRYSWRALPADVQAREEALGPF